MMVYDYPIPEDPVIPRADTQAVRNRKVIGTMLMVAGWIRSSYAQRERKSWLLLSPTRSTRNVESKNAWK